MSLVMMPILAGGLLLCLFFVFKKTRPLGWALLGLSLLAILLFVGYASTHRQRIAMMEHHRMRAMQAQAHAEWLRATEAMEGARVDLDSPLFRSHIELGEEAPPEEPHDHATHPSHPVEAVEAAPPEPLAEDDGDEDSPDAVSDTSKGPPEPSSKRSDSAAERITEQTDEERPEWVDKTPARDAQNYPVVVITDPFETKLEADRQITQLIMIATSDVVSDLVGSYPMHNYLEADHQTRFNVALAHLRGMGLIPGRIRSEVLRDEYVERNLDLGLVTGPMLRVHALLEFDEDFQNELQQLWRAGQARERLEGIGFIAACVLGLLAVIWGLLKFDTATKGYYTKWIVGAATVAGIGLVLLILAEVA